MNYYSRRCILFIIYKQPVKVVNCLLNSKARQTYINAFVDADTGEVLSEGYGRSRENSEREGTYWKVYPAAGAAISDVPFGFILYLINSAGYANNGQRVYLMSKQKKLLAEKCGISERMAENYIARLVDDEALCRVKRGEYTVNPYFFGRGKWSDIIAMRKEYDYLKIKSENNEKSPAQ